MEYTNTNTVIWSHRTKGDKACAHEGSYLGGERVSSRNSSILLVSVFTSVPYSRKGGWAPGARSLRMSGFLPTKQRKRNGIPLVLQMLLLQNGVCVRYTWKWMNENVFFWPDLQFSFLEYSVYNVAYYWLEENAKKHQPLHVNGGHIKGHAFQPQDHEEPLRKRAVPNALTITSCLRTHTENVYGFLIDCVAPSYAYLDTITQLSFVFVNDKQPQQDKNKWNRSHNRCWPIVHKAK